MNIVEYPKICQIKLQMKHRDLGGQKATGQAQGHKSEKADVIWEYLTQRTGLPKYAHCILTRSNVTVPIKV